MTPEADTEGGKIGGEPALEETQFLLKDRVIGFLVGPDGTSEDDEQIRSLPLDLGEVLHPRLHIPDPVAMRDELVLQAPQILEGDVADRQCGLHRYRVPHLSSLARGARLPPARGPGSLPGYRRRAPQPDEQKRRVGGWL